MKKFIVSIFYFLFISCGYAQSTAIIKLADLQQRYLRNNDTVYVLNFWATWCGPCVQELPGFEKLNIQYKDKKFKMLLVSLDFKKDLNKLEKFRAAKKLSAEIVLLDETKYNEWIDKINPAWGGAIPATLFIKNSTNYMLFHEKSLNFEELESIVKPLINQ